MKISVIIPTYEKWSVLSYVLKRFDEVSFDKNDFEVIVCANGSKIPEGYFERLNLKYHLSVMSEKEPNRALARNRCIVRAKGEILVFTDDDTLVSNSFLQEHYIAHQKKKCVAVGIRKQIIVPELEEYNFETDVEKRSYSAIYYKTVIESILQKGSSKNWACSITGNMSVEKDELIAAGFFDENFNGWGFEDVEMGYRLAARGNRFVLAKKALNYHIEHKRNRKDMIDEMYENIRYFYQKQDEDIAIKDYWEFYCGRISLQEFDRRHFRESKKWDEQQETYFELFKRRGLPELTRAGVTI